MTLNEIGELMKICQSYGIIEFKSSELEMRFTVSQPAPQFAQLNQIVEQITPTNQQLESEDLLYWSSPGMREPVDSQISKKSA